MLSYNTNSEMPFSKNFMANSKSLKTFFNSHKEKTVILVAYTSVYRSNIL